MSFSASRLQHYVQVFDKTEDGFDHTEIYTLVFDARAECLVRSGNEAASFSTTVTSTVITVLMWFDSRMNNTQVLDWNGVKYAILHIKPDVNKQSMIATCEVME